MLIAILVGLLLCLILWMIDNFIPGLPSLKMLLSVLVTVAYVVWALQKAGLLRPML